jgi:hypothetical protein
LQPAARKTLATKYACGYFRSIRPEILPAEKSSWNDLAPVNYVRFTVQTFGNLIRAKSIVVDCKSPAILARSIIIYRDTAIPKIA